MRRRLLLIFWLSVFGSGSSSAQSVGGGIIGQVHDPRGDAVPAALIQVVNTSTGQIRAISTDDEGRYQASEIPPGLYDLTILAAGFNSAKVPGVRVGVAEGVHLEDVTLSVSQVGSEKVEVNAAVTDLTETDTPAQSSEFEGRQIRELPILTRDVNNLALLAPSVISSRTFSFASTLVPFAVNGSRGRDVNFVIDSVDNNEPLFGGAATQFTNTDLVAEYRILTSLYKAEFGRHSGGVVNIITQRGGNEWHGSAFWFAQRDALNATSLTERAAGLAAPVPLNENVLGMSLGGPIRRDSTWFFGSYQNDRMHNDLTALYPQIATLPTVGGLNTLSRMTPTRTLLAYLDNPTVSSLPVSSAPCVGFIPGLPASNPCTTGSVPLNLQNVSFGTYLVPNAGAFDLHDQQLSLRLDRRLSQKDDFSARYLLDDVRTPRSVGASPVEVAFFDAGLLPGFNDVLAQRTQNVGAFWTHAWPHALHELRLSYSRIASQAGALNQSESSRETLPAITVLDDFALGTAPGSTTGATNPFLSDFPAAGSVFTLGLDSRPRQIRSNLYQLQDNFSISAGRHSVKFGVNLVQTLSGISDINGDLGEYFYFGSAGKPGFQSFVDNDRLFAFQTFPNFGGQGGEVLPIRLFSHFYFVQDDIRAKPWLTFTIGLRYENFGQPANRIAELNPSFGSKIEPDNMDFGPRAGFALSLGQRMALRGGYGIYYNSTPFNIPLAAWQSGQISPFVAGQPTNVYPQPPFNPSDVLTHFNNCDGLVPTNGSGPTYADCTNQVGISPNLRQPLAQNFGLSLARQIGRDFLFQVTYTGNESTRLYERLDVNPRQGWRIENICVAQPGPCAVAKPRLDPNHQEITVVNSGARSSYHSLQVSATKRYTRPGFFRGLAFTGSYTLSHMIDTSSEIFGPELRRVRGFKQVRQEAGFVEISTPFAQDSTNAHAGERGNSSFDRRHRGSLSALWSLPGPSSGARQAVLGGWILGGILSGQSGQPFSPLNSYAACIDANGDGILTNDRPSIGNPAAPLNSVAIIRDPSCINVSKGYKDLAGNPIDPATAHFVQNPLGVTASQPFTVPMGNTNETFVAGNAGRNILVGPHIINLDLSVIKDFKLGERAVLQFRLEAYDLLNKANPGVPIGNVFSAAAQAVPALAFGGGSASSPTPSRVSGLIPENSLDAFDPAAGALFLSTNYMNTSSRRLQAALRFTF
ncbi:MAG: hypothetical protein DMG31_02450 [Acidobacteria bacterium]|nr:MAG: hypothetical protein DMG31_02450 [Acidobacteriota bacterium]